MKWNLVFRLCHGSGHCIIWSFCEYSLWFLVLSTCVHGWSISLRRKSSLRPQVGHVGQVARANIIVWDVFVLNFWWGAGSALAYICTSQLAFLACSRSPYRFLVGRYTSTFRVSNHNGCWSQQVLSWVVQQPFVHSPSTTSHDCLTVLRNQLVWELGTSVVGCMEGAGCSLLRGYCREVAVVSSTVIKLTNVVFRVFGSLHMYLQILGQVYLLNWGSQESLLALRWNHLRKLVQV